MNSPKRRAWSGALSLSEKGRIHGCQENKMKAQDTRQSAQDNLIGGVREARDQTQLPEDMECGRLCLIITVWGRRTRIGDISWSRTGF